MRRYHHLGIPTTKQKPGEMYLEKFDIYVSGYGKSPYNIEWSRYGEKCTLPELVKTVAHIAFEVDDLDAEIAGKNVIIQPNYPAPGIRVAFIEDNGAPVEFLQIDKAQHP